jgi:hypothetical protein
MKDFTPHQQALELKELGFDEPCYGFYDEFSNNKIAYGYSVGINKAPTYSQAFRFFREKYDLRIWIESNYGVLKFEYVIATTNPNFIDKQFNDFSGYKTYEEAELACLIKLIEITRTK